MAGDLASFERGLRKAIVAPFRSAFFVGLSIVVLIFGRMLIDLAWTGRDLASVEQAALSLNAEIAAADGLPEIGGHTGERAGRWALAAYELFYRRTGIDRVLVADPEALSSPERAARRGAYALAARPHWQAVMIGTQTLAARAAMLPAALPTLLLAYLIALADGLIARAIRRASGARESATRYHRAKYLHASLLSCALLAWFWSPVPIPLPQLALAAALVGLVLVRLQAKYYKKYL